MVQTATIIDPSTARRMTLAAHAAFVPTGIATVLLGPLLPTLSARWALSDAQAGSLFSAQFGGALIGTLLSGVIAARHGYRFPIVAGLIMMALGVGLVLSGPWAAGFACVAAYGFGFGLTVPASNLSVAEANPGRRGAALNLLNFSWSLGAVACPFLVAASAHRQQTPLFLHLAGGATLLIALVISRVPYPAAHAPAAGLRMGELVSDRFIPIFAALFFLYVGAENALGGWVASYAHRVSEGQGTMWVMTPSFFYGALLLGRGLAPLALRRVPELALARAGLATAVLGTVGLLVSASLGPVLGCAALSGLGLSAVFPLTVSLMSHKLGVRASRVGSMLFALSNFGGATLPWLVGSVSTRFASLQAGLGVPLVAAVLMMVLYAGEWRLPTSKPALDSTVS
jgi:fucose permease